MLISEGDQMKKYKFLIAGGNSTLLVVCCPENQKEQIVRKGLKMAEQVGFVQFGNGQIPSLEMMGSELCINATLALAKLCGGSGELITSGANGIVRFSNYKDEASIKLKLPYIKDGEIVILPGIGYKLIDNSTFPLAAEASSYCDNYCLPAFGLLKVTGNQINPWVFVKKTNSFVPETACGSGSIALNILQNAERIIQPTGQRINIRKNGNEFTVSAKVVKMKSK